MITLTPQQEEHYYKDYRSFNAAVEAAFNDGYEQAVKDMQHIEETGVLIP